MILGHIRGRGSIETDRRLSGRLRDDKAVDEVIVAADDARSRLAEEACRLVLLYGLRCLFYRHDAEEFERVKRL